jgi:hypothetical protein
MSDHKTDSDTEFSAMHAVYAALAPLDEDARLRVVDYIVARLEISPRSALPDPPADTLAGSRNYEGTLKEEKTRLARNSGRSPSFTMRRNRRARRKRPLLPGIGCRSVKARKASMPSRPTRS